MRTACADADGTPTPAVTDPSVGTLNAWQTAGVAADRLVHKHAPGAQLLVHAPGLAGLQRTS